MTQVGMKQQNGVIVAADGRPVTASLVLDRLSSEPEAIRNEVTGIRFSKVLLDPVVRLIGEFPDQLRVELGIRKNGKFHNADLSIGHCIVGSTWHPIDVERCEQILGKLESESILLGAIDASTSFRLSTAFEGSLLFEDCVHRKEAVNWVSGVSSGNPVGLRAKLYPYQELGYQALSALAANGVGALLADEMGLGKTVQAIALIVTRSAERVLVVLPASLMENWVRELAQFAPDLSVFTHVGPQRPGLVEAWTGYDVVMATYETVVNDIGMFSEDLWGLVVLDEAQQIRNPDSQRAIAVKRIPKTIGLAVTGTPVENTLRDLWSLSEFVLPPLLGRLEEFEHRYPEEHSAAVRLGEIVAPITIRRLVSEVAQDLPEKVEIPTAFGLPASIGAVYDSIANSRSAFEANTTLRVICAHANKELDLGVDEFAMLPKVAHVLSLLEEIFEKGEKALLFGSFSLTLQRLQELLMHRFTNRSFPIIDGTVPVAERQVLIDEFTKPSEGDALILNPDAAGVGLNMTAANHVIHFNPEYNPAVTKQATARSFRRRQERPVFVHHLFYVATVEERAVGISQAKQEIAGGVDEGVRGR